MLDRPGWSLEPLSSSWKLEDVIKEICETAGIPVEYVDASQLTGFVDGIDHDSKDEAYKTLEALSQIFSFDAASFSGKINFVLRGNDEVFEIPEEDFIVFDDSERKSKDRRDSITVPKVLHLEYYDPDGGLDPFKQTSDRSLDNRAVSEVKISTPVVMRASDAAKAVVINHKVSIEEQGGDEELTLSDKYLQLTDSDCVLINGRRLRVIETEIDSGVIKLKLRQDRKSAYISTSEGVPALAPPEPPTLLVGETIITFIDSHIISDSDDRLGYYIAVSRLSGEWYGAVIEISFDGGSNFSELAEVYAEAVIGRTLSNLPSFSKYCPDDVNELIVELLQEDELESTDLAGMLSRSNLALVGNEIINFQNAEQIDVRKWKLSGFLRGRKGSEVVSHSAAERFVLLDRQSLYFINANLFAMGRTVTFRVTSVGLEFGNLLTVTFNGNSQIERPVANLQAHRKGENILISWVGVGRLGGGMQARHGVNFQKYVVSVNSETFETFDQWLIAPDPGGNVTIEVSQYNSITGAGPKNTVQI